MSPAVSERWQKIVAFEFDAPGAIVTFEDKLIRETGWTRHFAGRAIEEYRRFLLLAAESGHAVSPSPAVDEVWHLHLLYTRSYWERLCPAVLGFAFHHEPTVGTTTDRAKLDDWYARTLQSYATIFGTPPPEDLWPAKPRVTVPLRADPSHQIVVSRRIWVTLLALTSGSVLVSIALLFVVLNR